MLLALSLGGLGQAPSAGAQEGGDPLAAVQALLDRRAAAVRDGERDAFLSTVDPGAPAAFRAAQARSFDGWQALPLASYALQARVDDTGDLSVGVRDRYGGARVFLPETRQVYRLDGFDDRDAVETLWLTYVERDGRWYVGGDDDLSPLGLDTQRNLWDLGPVQLLPTEHFLVVSDPTDAPRAAELSAMAEEAMGILAARWRSPWSERIPIVVPRSAQELEVMLQTTFDLDNFVAFVVNSVVRDDGWAATAPRMYVQDENLRAHTRAFQLETLVHELQHAAAAPVTGPFVPAWVAEGVADWVATGASRSEVRPRGSDGVLPRDFEFTTGGGGAIVLAYRESRSAISFLARRAGPDGPAALLATLGQRRVAPGDVDHQVDAVLRDVAGEGFLAFERMWAGR